LAPAQAVLARFFAERIVNGTLGERTPVIVQVGIRQGGQTFPDLLYNFEEAGVRAAHFVYVECDAVYLDTAREIVANLLKRRPLRAATAFDVRLLQGDLFARPGEPGAIADSLRCYGPGPADLVDTANAIGHESLDQPEALRALSTLTRADAIVALGTVWTHLEVSVVHYPLWTAADLEIAGPHAPPFATARFIDESPWPGVAVWDAFEQSLAARLAPEMAVDSDHWRRFVRESPALAEAISGTISRVGRGPGERTSY